MDETSLEIVDAREMYPKLSFTSDDGELTVPFTLLSGEGPLFRGNSAEGILIITNYRLYHSEGTYINIPLGLIEYIECKEIVYLWAYCKDGRSYRCTFENAEDVQKWFKRIQSCIKLPEKIDYTFAFRFYSWVKEEKNEGIVSQTHSDINALSDSTDLQFERTFLEAERMGFDLKSVWKISKLNKDQKLCASYPRYLIVPFTMQDSDMEDLANFRCSSRVPAVVWRHQQNGCIIARSSQPRMGILGWRRNYYDEKLLEAFSLACLVDPGYKNRELNTSGDSNFEKHSSDDDISIVCADPNAKKPVDKKLLIVDARSYTAAISNRAKGGGYESDVYYSNIEIQYMGLANIHAIRNSFACLRALCATPDEQNWLSSLETTKWLHHISGLIRAASLVVNAIDVEERPVLVHCSDGWDRTPQLVALAEIMLDPYYRTKKGFQVLVEREWLEFGHKFADRCGHSDGTTDTNERSPVFLQWLDCVFQLLRQFQCHFEFNEQYLARLVLHTYSCLFGTFLCNTDECRSRCSLPRRTFSVWPVLNEKSQFTNYLYNHSTEVLRPSCQIRSIEFWGDVYLPNNSSNLGRSTVPPIEEPLIPETDERTTILVKTKSCDNLHNSDHSSSLQRRKSDPNLVENTSVLYPQLPDLTNKTILSVPNQIIEESADVCKDKGDFDKLSERTDIALVHNSNLSLREPTIDGSTDTLVSELGASMQDTDKSEMEQSFQKSVCSVSTDTSDLPPENFNHMDGLPNWCQNAIGAYICSKRNDASNSCSCSYTTPNHSRTPSSGFPATPCDDSGEMPNLKRDSCQIMDFDGLNIVPDSVQDRIKKLILHYKNKVHNLQMDLSSTRAEVFCRNYQGKTCCVDGEEAPSLPDSGSSGDHPAEIAGSESSWDFLWSPENATSHHGM